MTERDDTRRSAGHRRDRTGRRHRKYGEAGPSGQVQRTRHGDGVRGDQDHAAEAARRGADHVDQSYDATKDATRRGGHPRKGENEHEPERGGARRRDGRQWSSSGERPSDDGQSH